MTKTKSALALANTAPDYEIDTDKSRLDLAFVHDFLVRSHWAKGIPFAVMAKAIENSITFGLYRDGRQIGFARVVTDHATFAYLADVFIAEQERNCGLGRSLVETILAHPELQGMRRWLLGTRDAQSLYRRCGFAEPPASFRFLERLIPGGYAEVQPVEGVLRRRQRRRADGRV
jgi:ribosomal protein S18 acetylase RimI-like enzyme